MNRKIQSKNVTAVSISTSLFKKIEERIEGTKFTSVSSYIEYVLREVLTEEDEEGKRTLTSEEEDKIKERLKDLGYM